MKKFYFLIVSIVTFSFVFFTNDSWACIDPGPDTTVKIIVTYDTTNAPCIDEVSLRITNLRFMSENPGKLCSCAFDALNPIMQNVVYIAFVDSGTNNPYSGFAAWNTLAASSLAWNNSQPGFSWSGYVASVIGSGLSANSAVELVIRLQAPANQKYTLTGDTSIQAVSLMDHIESTTMGTDEWSDTNQDLVAAHQALYPFDPALPGNSIQYVPEALAFFTQLDDDILNNIPTGIQIQQTAIGQLSIFPQPADEVLHIAINVEQSNRLTIKLFDVNGKQLRVWNRDDLTSGMQQMHLPVSEIPAGIYMLQLSTSANQLVEKIIIR